MPRVLPHVQPSPHPLANRQISVRIVAKENRTKGGVAQRDLHSGEFIDAKSGIEFQAIQQNGLPFPKDYKVRWQVVNTDRAAAADNGLRGGFYPSDTHGYRHEATKYRGVHWVQAFLVNKRTGFLDGISDRFFVVIR
jgi:Adenylyl/Guanylyl and SMODS C-terminal sensor domain